MVVVGWNDTTATVQSVKDSAGNTYSLAIGPTSGTGLRQSIYYAANIAGGSNTVTVTFSQAAAYPDIRILEYRGVTTLDVTAGASGSSAEREQWRGDDDECERVDLWGEHGGDDDGAAGSGFTSRIITSPDGDIAEDKIVTTAGSNSATATLNLRAWVMQMVTFSAVSGPVPTVSSVSPNSGSTAGGTAVTITGTNFVAGATVTFGATAATNVVVVNSTTITATTPAGSAGAVTVTVTNPEWAERKSGQRVHLCCSTDSEHCFAEQRVGRRRDGCHDHRDEFAAGATVTFGGTAATNVVVVSSDDHHGDDPGGQRRCGDRDGDGQRAERKLWQVASPTLFRHGEQCVAKHWVNLRRDGGDDHRDEFCRGRDGDVRSCGSDERGGGEQHHDHGHDAGRQCRCGDRDGNEFRRSERKFGQRIHLCSCADGEQCIAEQWPDSGWYVGDDHGDELCRGSDGHVWRDGSDERGGRERDARSPPRRRRSGRSGDGNSNGQ